MREVTDWRKLLGLALLTAGVVIGAAAKSDAQFVRHETGRRLRAFESDWSATSDKDARRRALVPLQQSVNQFLGGKELAAAQSLDRARLALKYADVVPANVAWAESLALEFDRHFCDSSESLRVTARAFYDAGSAAEGAVLTAGDKVDLDRIPREFALPLSGQGEGDHSLPYTIVAEGQTLAAGEYRYSLAENLPARLAALRSATVDYGGTDQSVDRQSIAATVELLGQLAASKVFETDYPAARLLREAEEAVKEISAGRPYYAKQRSGEFWLRIPLAPRPPLAVRVFVPEEAATRAAVPLVVALHGAGGSENLFFDGYGRGAIVELCRSRGWLLVSPRTSGFGLLPVSDLVAAVSQLYPVDARRVMIMGHSMGAMQATAAAQARPEAFAAVAALGGGGVAKSSEALKRLPYFVAAGSEDFALSGARRLEKNLRAAGSERLAYREYPDVEHLLIVQEALPDVFQFFDQALNTEP